MVRERANATRASRPNSSPIACSRAASASRTRICACATRPIVARDRAWFAARSGRPAPRRDRCRRCSRRSRLRGVTLANRVVVSPMAQYSCADGTPDDYYLVHLGSRAHGGAGLVFTEMTCVSADARISPGCAGMYKQEHKAAWKRIVDYVHRAHAARRSRCSWVTPGRKARRSWAGRTPTSRCRAATGRSSRRLRSPTARATRFRAR